MLSSNMLLLNLILLIDVTFSTPTGDYTSLRRLFAPSGHFECYGDVTPRIQTNAVKGSETFGRMSDLCAGSGLRPAVMTFRQVPTDYLLSPLFIMPHMLCVFEIVDSRGSNAFT